MSDAIDADDNDGEDDDSDLDGADNVGDTSVEMNVDDLLRELEKESRSMVRGEMSARRRLEELLDDKRTRSELEDFEDYDF
jgi:hypothetical protein